MSGTPKQAVGAPPAVPPRSGLLIVAQPAPGSDRWQGGIRWSPEQTLGGGAADVTCGGSTLALGQKDNPAWSEADPFLVWTEDHCSTLGSLARDFEGRARRQLEAVGSFYAARELWKGELAQAASLDNNWLTRDPALLEASAAPVDTALRLIEQGLGEMLGGRRGMVHVSPAVLDALAVNNALQLNGQVWLTPMGNVVVADAGYPGDAPDDADSSNQWIYGTPMIQYKLDPVNIVPGDLAQFRAQATDKATNTTKVYAERLVLLQWDSSVPIGDTGKVGVLAAETDVPAFVLQSV